jgi:hypothetical protein
MALHYSAESTKLFGSSSRPDPATWDAQLLHSTFSSRRPPRPCLKLVIHARIDSTIKMALKKRHLRREDRGRLETTRDSSRREERGKSPYFSDLTSRTASLSMSDTGAQSFPGEEA